MSVKSRYLFFLAFVPFVFSAQNNIHEVTGGILSESGVPIEFATVKLLNANDSSLINAMYADEQGKFKFNAVNCNTTYILTISNVGYMTMYLPPFISITCTSHDYGFVRLAVDATLNLEEVKVQAQIDVLKAGIDKKIYNVGQDISVRGGTANDVLNRLPSVEVDEDGGVTLRGD